MLSGAIDYVSANAGGGAGGDFDPTYMSAQIDNKLNKSEVGFRKVNGVDYVSGISGKTISARYASTAQNANTANYANTAYYDDNGNSLTTTYYNAQEANNKVSDLFNFVQSNSSNWEGGSSPASEGVLFHHYHSDDPNYGSQSDNSWISGATELHFEASLDSQSYPSDLVITRNGSEIGRVSWSQVSSDGYYNYFAASYKNSDGGEVGIQNTGPTFNYCYVSANGVKTQAFSQGDYFCSTDKTVKFNIDGHNFQGYIEGWSKGGSTQITSFTGGLTDFTAKGYERYVANINYVAWSNYYYDLSAEFVEGGSTVASGDVFPPTNNLDPYATYYLGWNANNGGLFWYNPGNGGN
jgi:hypothetical protein